MFEITKEGDLDKYKERMYERENLPLDFVCLMCGCEFVATKQDYKSKFFSSKKVAFCPKCNSKVIWKPDWDWD